MRNPKNKDIPADVLAAFGNPEPEHEEIPDEVLKAFGQKKNPLATTSKPSGTTASPIQSQSGAGNFGVEGNPVKQRGTFTPESENMFHVEQSPTNSPQDNSHFQASGNPVKPAGTFAPQSLDEAHAEDKNWAGNLWNRVVSGTSGLVSGATDKAMSFTFGLLPESVLGTTSDNAVKQFRESVTPTVKGQFEKAVGANVTPQEKKNFDEGFWSGAIGGLVESAPAILAPKGARAAALFYQAYDGALRSINSTDAGAKLPESTKTNFAIITGGAQAAFEKIGLDKIIGKQSTKVATKLAAKTVAELVEKSKVPITAAMVDQAILAGAKGLKEKVVKAGGKIGTGALVEFTTGSLQEASTILAETLTNKATGKEVFADASFAENAKRIVVSGAAESVGGAGLSIAAMPFSKTRNYIAEQVAAAKSPEDILRLKLEIGDNVNLTQEQANIISETIDNYVRVNSKIPEGTANRKEVAEKIIEREEIETELAKKESELQNTDAAFQAETKKDIELLNNRAQEINGEISEISKTEKVEETEAPKTEQPTVSESGVESLKEGDKLQWDAYGNEGSEEWTVGKRVKTRGGQDAVVLSKRYIESAKDGSTHSKEYADANGIKYDNEHTIEHTVPLSDLNKTKTEPTVSEQVQGENVGKTEPAGKGIETPKTIIPNKVQENKPIEVEVYRGQHGSSELESRLGSFSFTENPETAKIYSESPNNKEMDSYAKNPTIIKAKISIKNPVINTPDDPFIDIMRVSEILGEVKAKEIAIKYSDQIKYTNNWEENYSEFESVKELLKERPEELKNLYLDAYNLFDDSDVVKAFKEKGYDGAVHAGVGENSMEPEYRVFDKRQIELNKTNIGDDFEGNHKAISDITEQVVADRKSNEAKANRADDESNKPISDRLNEIDAEIGKMRSDNAVNSDGDLMRKVAKENVSDFHKLVLLQSERDNLSKELKYDNRKAYDKETEKIISDKTKPYQDAIDKEQDRIGKSISELSKELGATENDLKWGDKQFDEELGDRIGDNKSAVFIKPHESDIETPNGMETVNDGLTVELVTVNPKNRGEGLAKKRLKQITDAADKHNLTLFLDAVPQEKNITEEGLKKLYKQYGFEFDGFSGKRKPKTPKTEDIIPNKVQEGNEVKLPSQVSGGLERNMVYDKGEWKQKVGNELTKVSDKVQQQAQDVFVAKNEPTKTEVVNENIEPTKTTIVAKTEPIENKQATGEGAPSSKKQSVLERPKEEVSIDDVLGELLGDGETSLHSKEISNDSLKSGDKKSVDEYVSGGKTILGKLYPKAKLETYETTAEYEKNGGDVGTRGNMDIGKNGEHVVRLDLERIRKANSGKTVAHEIGHIIVFNAFGTKNDTLVPLWNEIANDLHGVKGFKEVIDFASEYHRDNIAKEGLTELLARVVNGDISLKDVPKSTVNKVIELINKFFETIGLENFKINDVNDFHAIAEKFKTAFETGETKGLDKIAKRKNIEKTLAEYEKKGLKLSSQELDPAHREKLINLLKQKVSEEIKSGKLTSEQAQKIFDKAGIKEPPPEAPKVEGKEEPKGKPKSLANRLVEAKNVPEAAKEGIKAEGLTYEPKSQKEAEQLAKAIIDEDGIDSAVLQAQAGKFGGDVNTLVQTEALNKLSEIESAAKTPQEKLDAAKQFAEISIGLDESLRKQGQAISAVNFFYKKSPLGIQIMENVKRKQEFDNWSKPKEKSWKEAFDDMMKEPEFEELVKEKVKEGIKQERAEARKTRIEKVDKFFDAAIDSFSKSGATYSTIIPPKVITTALEGMKKAYHAGEKVAEIIEKAVDYISEELGGASWDKDKFREEWDKRLKEPTDKKPLTDEEVKAKYLDRMRKKLTGMNDRQREDVILKSHKKIIESGGLDFQDFRKIIAEVTGRGEMTDAEAAKLKQLVSETNKVDEAGKVARETRTQGAREAFRQAEIKAGTAAKELNTLLHNRPNITKRLTSMLQLNTLGIPALVNNPIYNAWNHLGLRLPVGIVKTGVDQAIYRISKSLGKEVLPETNVLSRQVQKEFFRKLGLGTREAVSQFVTGLDRMDYLNKEIQTDQIRPHTAMKDLWEYSQGKKNLTKTQVFDKMLQASPQGVIAEGIARTLNLGDKPMRFAADAAQAAAFAKSLGLKGIDFDLFIDFPREEAYRVYKEKGLSDAEAGKKADYVKETIVKEGERSTFQTDNFLTDVINKVFGGKNSSVGGAVKAVAISPYIKIPSNAYWSYFNLVNPEVAMMQSAMYGAKAMLKQRGTKFNFDKSNSTAAKDLHEAKYWFAHGVVGLATRAAVTALVAQGIFRPANSEKDTKKEREGEQNFEQQGSVNVSKLWEYMKGGDPSKVKKGLVIQNRWFGQFGSVGNTIARREEAMTPEQKENRDSYIQEVMGNLKESSLPELEQGIFGNTSGLLTALNMGGSFAQSWGANTLNMMTNIIHPAAMAQVSKAQLPYYTKVKADSFKEELKNDMLTRSSLLRRLAGEYPPTKVSIWGDKIEKQGGTIQKLFGITRSNDDNFAAPIYQDYKRTNNTKFFPSAVKPEVNNGKETIKLSVKEADRLAELVGQQRKELLTPFINDMAHFEGSPVYSKIKTDDEKVENLQIVYEVGYERGKELFLNENKQYKAGKTTAKEKADKKKESANHGKTRAKLEAKK